ncbi:MAG: DNA topoisomerase IB [Sphingomonadales bacterium]|nr:DNA topoisomerase IB [Sphingomonadales bacterium]
MRLVFLDDSVPGISRKLLRGKWAYFAPDGSRIRDEEEIARLNRIALPPAYRGAWYAPRPDAHLLAVGFDARGRKQYRYHPDYRQEREARKFELCAPFGRALPRLRARVAGDLAARKLTRERAIASVVALLDTGEIRVGNERYARENKSYGATTLRNRHARIEGGLLRLRFRSKSGKMREIACSDAALVRCVRRMQDLPGQHLFQYIDPGGEAVPVDSGDVNLYLRETMGEEFTARNFRTWAASALAFGLLVDNPDIALGALLEAVSDRLGNTPAIVRKSYVHPAVLAAAKGEAPIAELPRRLPRAPRWLSRVERGLIEFLETPRARAVLEAAPG